MTSKEFLDRPYHIKKKIRYLELELDRYKVMMNSIPQPSYGTVRVDKTPSTETPNQKALEKYYETEDTIKEMKEELKHVIWDTYSAIEKVDIPEYQSILTYKYIEGMTWDEISKKVYAAYSTVRKWHKLALESFRMMNNFDQ